MEEAEVLKRSPESVVEIEVLETDGNVYFHRFFCALKPCIDGFLEGCRPYTCSRLAFLLGENTSSQATTSTPERMPTAAPAKKLTPKRKLQIG